MTPAAAARPANPCCLSTACGIVSPGAAGECARDPLDACACMLRTGSHLGSPKTLKTLESWRWALQASARATCWTRLRACSARAATLVVLKSLETLDSRKWALQVSARATCLTRPRGCCARAAAWVVLRTLEPLNPCNGRCRRVRARPAGHVRAAAAHGRAPGILHAGGAGRVPRARRAGAPRARAGGQLRAGALVALQPPPDCAREGAPASSSLLCSSTCSSGAWTPAACTLIYGLNVIVVITCSQSWDSGIYTCYAIFCARTSAIHARRCDHMMPRRPQNIMQHRDLHSPAAMRSMRSCMHRPMAQLVPSQGSGANSCRACAH